MKRLVFVLVALIPTLAVFVRADEPDDSEADRARKRVLAKLVSDPAVLVNVTDREMPASPDILNLGKRSTAALERCLADNSSAYLRQFCAELIGVIGDRRALPSLTTALADWDPDVRASVAMSLSRIPDKSAVAPMLAALKRKDESSTVQLKIIAALGTIGSRPAIDALRKLLHAKKADKEDADAYALRAPAFAALWHSRHLMNQSTLVGDVAYALTNDDQSLVYAAVLASAELKAPQLVKPLVPLMQNPDVRVRNKSVYAIGKIGDKVAVRELLAELPSARDARTLNNIAFALERLDRPAFFREIQRLVDHKQSVIRMNAAFVVGDVKREEGLPLLERSLGDASNRVRIEAAAAVCKIGKSERVSALLVKELDQPAGDESSIELQLTAIENLAKCGMPSAIPRLEKFIDNKSATLASSAIYAIHALSGKQRRELIYTKLFQSRDSATRRAAAIAQEWRSARALVSVALL